MVESTGLPIREFIYFDEQKVQDFISAWEDGLLQRKSEARTERLPQWKRGFEWKVKFEHKGRTEERTFEEIRSATPVSLFERLYRILNEKQLIRKLEGFDISVWEQLQVGEFVEARVRIEFSALERLLNLMMNVADILPDGTFDPSIKAYIDRLLKTQAAYTIRIIPHGAPPEYTFVALISKDKLRTPKEELTLVESFVLGRIRRKLKAGEKFQIFSLLPDNFPSQLGEKELDNFLDSFREKEFPPILGSPPQKEDLQVFYPAIMLAPIAIYL